VETARCEQKVTGRFAAPRGQVTPFLFNDIARKKNWIFCYDEPQAKIAFDVENNV
jgi:hypothetical protein